VFNDVVAGPLLDADGVRKLVLSLPEFSVGASVYSKKLRRLSRCLSGERKCTESSDCVVRWSIQYFSGRTSIFPQGHLQIIRYGNHAHAGHRDSKCIMSPAHEAAAMKFFEDVASTMHKYRHFEDFLKSHNLLQVAALPPSQLRAWFHYHKKKHSRGMESSEILVPSSQRSVAVMHHMLAELQKPFPEELDALIILPDTPMYRGIALDASTQCILCSCRGMLEILARTTAPRLYISVDTFMAGNPEERGVMTISLLTKGEMRETSMYPRGPGKGHDAARCNDLQRSKVHCKAHTTRALPLLNAPLGEESAPNHIAAFQAFRSMWSLAQPLRPPLESLLYGMKKDFAAGIEAARRAVFPNTRPEDDFWHMMGRDKTMASKMSVMSETASGKHFHTNYDWMRACLYNFHAMGTADMINLCWPGYLRRLVSLHEVSASSYLYKEYTRRESVAQLIAWDCIIHATSPSELFMFLSWWGHTFPGLSCGEGPAESLHSTWKRELQRWPKAETLAEAIEQLSQTYREQWSSAYKWSDTAFHPDIFAIGEDMNTIAGEKLHKLQRHCAVDYWTTPELADMVHSFEFGSNYFVVYPMQIGSTALTIEEAELGASILCAAGDRLLELLLQAGILYEGSSSEKLAAREAVQQTLKHPRSKALQTVLLHFLSVVGLSKDAMKLHNFSFLLFQNARYNHFFKNAAYVHRDRLDGRRDPWSFLRCTCAAFRTYSRCEHVADARTKEIPGMVDEPLSSEMRNPKGKPGRKRGSYSTTRGQQQALKAKKT